MFGINKCFGGPGNWGVIIIVSGYAMGVAICEKLKEKDGGQYEVIPMAVIDDKDYITEELGIEL